MQQLLTGQDPPIKCSNESAKICMLYCVWWTLQCINNVTRCKAVVHDTLDSQKSHVQKSTIIRHHHSVHNYQLIN